MHGLNLPFLTMGNHHISSPALPHYNCVSHSIHEDRISYWPDDDNRWPKNMIRAETIAAFVAFFNSLMFQEIALSERGFSPGFEKIALYAVGDLPAHVARQLPNGRWTSKLGALVDIDHLNLECLEGGDYGRVIKIMKRQNTGKPQVGEVSPARPLILRP